MQTPDYWVLAGYFVMMIVIGLLCMRTVKRQEDFFLGGRSFGKLLQTFAAFGAGTGSNDPIQVGRTTWTSGLSGIWSVLMWLFVTPFYWIFAVWYRRMRHVTLGDWFVERYESKALGAAYTVFAYLFYIMYLSTMFAAVGKAAGSIIGRDELFLFGMPLELKYVLVPGVAVLVVVYGVLGGLRAAYWTDLIQGLCIIILSVILVPYGLLQLVDQHGDQRTQEIVEQYGENSPQAALDGLRIMHQRTPDSYYQIIGGPRSSEFPLHYIVSLSLLGLLGIVVQPHFIATGGGTAESENSARIGLVTGNFLKRFCTLGWALTALILLALLADHPRLAQDPDQVWGVATQEILGPLNLGLVGLMLACLLAALMSSADCYMIMSSALTVRNVFAPYIAPNADESTYLAAARVCSLFVIFGAALTALAFWDVFEQFKIAMEVAIVFAAPFWLGMFWRRATTWAAWGTILFSSVVFFVLPVALPLVRPELRTNEMLTQANHSVFTEITRPARESDVRRRQAEIALWEPESEKPRPQPLQVGQQYVEPFETGGRALFWSNPALATLKGTEVQEETILIDESEDKTTKTRIYKKVGQFEGQGWLRLELLAYQYCGVDLASLDNAMLETLRLPPRLLAPFVVMIVLSLLTPRNRRESLDRYYAKMKTPVRPDPEEDAQALEEAYADPQALEHKKWLPGSSLELQKPTLADVLGLVLCFAICFGFVKLAVWVANIGKGF